MSGVRIFLLLIFSSVFVQAQPLKQGQAVITHFSGLNSLGDIESASVISIVDIRNYNSASPGNNWNAPRYKPNSLDSLTWYSDSIGQVFGVAIDTVGNIYVAASIVYGYTGFGSAGAGGIYKLSNQTWKASQFIGTENAGSYTGSDKIPNTGWGLGNICNDWKNNQLFLTNFEDGKIYRLSYSGVVLNSFDPFIPDNGNSAIASYGERLWGVGINYESEETRLYFSVWKEDQQNFSVSSYNEIWSVKLDSTGDFEGDEKFEIRLEEYAPGANYSQPVSDIAFSEDGKMLLAERSMQGLVSYAHESRYLMYYGESGNWSSSKKIHVGNFQYYGGYCNSAGGIDFGYLNYDPVNDKSSDCFGMIWGTGDALKYDITSYIYGVVGIDTIGNSDIATAPNFVATSSIYIDLNSDTTDGPKSFYGGFEIFKNCNRTITNPPPPPPPPVDSVAQSPVTIKEICHQVNVVTNNSDGSNDFLEFGCLDSEGWQLKIYNRWGNLLFQSDNYHNDWPQSHTSDGVYYYVLINPNKEVIKGFFHLTH